MTILRIQSIEVVDSTTIKATFTENLDPSIGVSNVIIESQLDSVPDPLILQASISQNTITLTTQPLTSQAAYQITFSSIPGTLFQSLNGDAILYQDDITNKQIFLGPIETDNPVYQFLTDYLANSVYDVKNSTKVVNKIVQALSTLLSKALYDIRQVKNENYLSFDVVDEQKVRGSGPSDRLNEECAYNIVRVGRTPTGTSTLMNVPYTSFPRFPVSLLADTATDLLTAGSETKVNVFNINNFILTVPNQNVSKLVSLVFYYSDGRPQFTYDIETLGYQLLDSIYDQDHGFSYASLENNQFKISESILNNPKFSTQNIFNVVVNYEFRNMGRVVDGNNITVSTILSSVREVLPPLSTIFNLSHAPIVDSSGAIVSTGGVKFIDPNATTPSASHPAFVYEIPFNLANLPYSIGQYSIDYSSGTVYVFGSSFSNDGTGPYPPLATYSYSYTYKNNTDYTFDSESNAIVALPYGNLLNSAGTINFNYEQVLIKGVDYEANAHIEVLGERIENRLLALNVLTAQNSPITNVFRIYNETSGEIYGILRWQDNKIYFTYNTPPNVDQVAGERVSFTNVLNEILFVNQEISNSLNITIFKCNLNSNKIISGTEDSLASSINTSASFSNTSIFQIEKWWDGSGAETSTLNLNRLKEVGEYEVDYVNGVVYVAVDPDQDLNLGTISYKSNSIAPVNAHVLSVDDIYYRSSIVNPKDKSFDYQSFGNGTIVPKTFDVSDEGFLNGSLLGAYEVDQKTVGVFVDSEFIPGVTNNIKFVRGLYEYNDLQDNTSPLNFAESAEVNGKIITLNPYAREEFTTVKYDGQPYIELNLNLTSISDNFEFDISVMRGSDNLWDSNGEVIAGKPVRLNLSANNPQVGDMVSVSYSINISDLSRVIIDYNKGEYYIDYSYLADEILISYEYGENLLDFRKSQTLNVNDEYYVSYQVGALRDALLKNFGTLINVPELATLDIDLERERYRDAIVGALETFIVGPTIASMKTLVAKITHIEPDIIESVFQSWSLGSSLLNPGKIKTSGDLVLRPAKYGNGALINGQTISLPQSSNLKLDQGSFQAWIMPEWNGLDNDAPLTFNITRNNQPVNPSFIFIGAAEYHPKSSNFTLDKNDNVIGKPNQNKDGIFIYYDLDKSKLFKRWFVEISDGYTENPNNYTVKINVPDGLFYDVKSINNPKPNNLSIQSGTTSTTFKINASSQYKDGITFVADREHYLLDFQEGKNRFSIFKDPSGYLNFRVIDKNGSVYVVSSDISAWRAQELHHIGTSWVLNSKNGRDEMHLFIDGMEVPNISHYGDKTNPYVHEKFRTINPEEIAGTINKSIVGSIDLKTVAGSNVVSSSLDFSAYGINIGDQIYIDEIGFDTNGYSIVSENGNTLVLNSAMPSTLNSDGRFSVNRQTIALKTNIGLYSNIAVSKISSIYTGTDLFTINGANLVSTGIVHTNISPGDLIKIVDSNFAKHYTILNVSGNLLTLNDTMPITASNVTYYLYKNEPVEIPGVRALRPSYSIEDNNLTLSNNISANDLILITTFGLNHKRVQSHFYQWGNVSNIIKTRMPGPIDLNSVEIKHVIVPTTIVGQTIHFEQPSSSGRTLEVRISGSNPGFPVTVSINGAETLTFNDPKLQKTTNKYGNIFSISVNPSSGSSKATIKITEAYSITNSEGQSTYPVITHSYQTNAGITLSGQGNTVTDNNGFFSAKDIGNYLIISNTAGAGTYQILNVSQDHLSATIDGNLASFSGAIYQVLNTTEYRNGLQNGYFILEEANNPGVPYNLPQGTYEFDFYTYLSIPLDPISPAMFIGSNFNGKASLNGIIDELKINANKLSDTRVSESTLDNNETFTKDFNSLKALSADKNTLVLMHFDSLPLTNEADYYITYEDKKYIQSGISVNDNFNQSFLIKDNPIIIENDGTLHSKSEGTIEFWVNPLFDTANDPNDRYYFDASGVEIEKVVSLDDATVQTKGRISKVLSVRLQSGDDSDYFAGGYVEANSQGAIQEATNSANTYTVYTAKKILQVMSVRVAGDPVNKDYFGNGTISVNKDFIYLEHALPLDNCPVIITYKSLDGSSQTLNNQVIRLNNRLPNQNMPVEVTYIPSGMQGDRISIFKDKVGYVNFAVRANSIDYVVRTPAYWAANSWHRVKAVYSFNGGKGTDFLRLFVDGYEQGNILFGQNLLFGDPHVFGSTFSGRGNLQANIKFKDFLGELYIGSAFTKKNSAYALIDNLRISDIARPVFKPYGESIDVNYNKNLDVVFPTTKDLYTTLLLDFETLLEKNTDFISLIDKKSGIFDFEIDIFDEFGIVAGSAKVKQLLETLINVLKPANSRVFLKYL